MKLKDFRLGWRVLSQTPVYSLIMIAGLTVGFAVMFLTLAFSRYEFGFDRHVPQRNDVYVLKAQPNWGMAYWSENVPYAMKAALDRSPNPPLSTAVLPYGTAMQVGNVVHKVELTIVDLDFPKVFGIKALEGDLSDALSRADSIVLSAPTALSLFGKQSAVGKTVTILGQPYQVAAIVAEQPETSSLKFQALAGSRSNAWSAQQRERAGQNWNYYTDSDSELVHNKIYVRAAAGADLKQLGGAIADDIDSSALRGHLNSKDAKDASGKKLLNVAFGPLADSHLDTEARMNSGAKGDPVSNYVMNAVAFIILLLTTANYVNLATIRTIERQREIAVRKVLGVSPGRLVGQMLVESILVAMLGAILGAILAWGLLPAWSELSEHNMVAVLTRADWLVFGALVLSMGLLIGIGGGLYPAWVALKMRPSEALGGRGNSETAGGLLLRRILTVFQFGIAMFVTGMVIAISWQIRHLKQVDYGYQLDSLLTISIPADLSNSQVDSFRDALANEAAIKGVSATTPTAADVEFINQKAEPVVLRTWHVGAGYFSTIGLPAIAGRVFNARLDTASSNVVVINSLAAQHLGFASDAAALGQFVTLGGKPVQIVGISKDVSRGFTRGSVKPTAYDLVARTPALIVNGGSDLTAARAAIQTVWRRHFPALYLDLKNERATLELNAGGPQAILDTCTIVAIITIPLSVFSIYILSSFAVQRRTREIVVRKLYGATPADIARLLVHEFALLIAIAAGISLPLSFVAGRMFVQQFADQAPIGPWAIVAAGGGALLVTALACARHTMTAVRLSPVVVLRTA